jgi:hypothetical protein
MENMKRRERTMIFEQSPQYEQEAARREEYALEVAAVLYDVGWPYRVGFVGAAVMIGRN